MSTDKLSETAWPARLGAWCKSLVDWRPAIAVLPRSQCRFLTLEARETPSHLLTSSVRLQLLQLTGLEKAGFVFYPGKDKISVWYWDESRTEPEKLPCLHPQKVPSADIAPWPESVLRATPNDGLHLLQLNAGYEAVCVKMGETRRTRWYAEIPDQEKWAAFARDAGYPVQGHLANPPAPGTLPFLPHPPKGWKLHSAFLKPIRLETWVMAAAFTFLGAFLLAAGAYQIKLGWAIQTEQKAIERISSENADTIALQSRIAEQSQYLDRLQSFQPEALQLRLMQTLSESGLIDAEKKISLLEWEYRNKQLRLLFAVPPNLELGAFLTQLEALPIFREIRLLPDTPPRTIGVQTVIAPWPLPEEEIAPPEASPKKNEANPETQADLTPSLAEPRK